MGLELIFEREMILINMGLGYEKGRELRETVQTVWDMGLELIFDRQVLINNNKKIIKKII